MILKWASNNENELIWNTVVWVWFWFKMYYVKVSVKIMNIKEIKWLGLNVYGFNQIH